MLKEVLATIIQLLVIFGWILIIRLIWQLPDRIADLNLVLREVYGGVTLLLWKYGFLKPLEKGKVVDTETGKVNLTFDAEFIKKLDAHWEKIEKLDTHWEEKDKKVGKKNT